MQINEDLIKQITNAVLTQMGQAASSASSPSASDTSLSEQLPSLAGKERINEEKTSYRDYPRARKGTDRRRGRFSEGNYENYQWNSSE